MYYTIHVHRKRFITIKLIPTIIGHKEYQTSKHKFSSLQLFSLSTFTVTYGELHGSLMAG